ncbi:MAG: hypothetical protein LBI90_02615 [Treponema sp.]|jgi:hypothetical protein|nr:hypothetical protein [Treponema sp.]
MRKAQALFLFLFLMIFSVLQAQEDDEEIPEDEIPIDIYDGFRQELYSRGDQTFNISLGPIFPTVFLNNAGKVINHKMFVLGGEGFLSYNYFLNSHAFIGLEISGMFIQTASENMYFAVPISGRLGWQFILSRFEFPAALSIGMVSQQYMEQRNFGFFLKPSLAAYFRFSPEWSFGLDAGWWWVPQWTKNEKTDAYGNFMATSLAVRYHF